jgi:ATP-dependent DNA helicase RecQ
MSLIYKALEKHFGYKKFRPGQEEIINSILAGENVLAVLPTGAGKSLCYQIPALVSGSFSIVISPLIALMKDQVDSLNARENIAAFINSSLDFRETEYILNEIAEGKYKLLYVAPERLENMSFAERIKRLNPDYLFVDEAHCISEWGHNFRPSYRKIKEFIDFAELKNISAFTATATPEVEQDILKQLGLQNPKVFVRGFDRENLLINIIHTIQKKEKTLQLVSQNSTPAIIYTASRKKAEEVCEYLNLNKIKCAYYHAGLSPIERKYTQENFLNGKIPVIAATNAFGMGIDKKDIRLVIHYNAPGSIEAYYQEIGRAGRDGKTSNTFLLYDKSDIELQEFLISSSNPDLQTVQDVYNALLDYGRVAVGNMTDSEIEINFDFINMVLARQVQRGVLKAAIKILENAGYLREISNYEKKSSVKFLLEPNRLKNYVKKSSSANIRELCVYLLRKYGADIFRNKINIETAEIADALDADEAVIEETLIKLDETGIISFYRPPSSETVLMLQPRVETKRMALDMKSVNESYLNQKKKLAEIEKFAHSGECRFKFILKYFGDIDNLNDCGRCDNCLNQDHKSSAEQQSYLGEIILRTMFEYNMGISHNYIVNTLTGKSRSPVLQKVSTFGSCRNYKTNEISAVFFDLAEQKLVVKIDILRDKYIVSDKGISLLTTKGVIEDAPKPDADYEKNLILYHKLREVRAGISKRFMQNERLVCPDETLRAIVLTKPATKSEILKTPGFTERMYNKTGEQFLEAISFFLERYGSQAKNSDKDIMRPENGQAASGILPKNIYDTYKLLTDGYSLKDIAKVRKLSEPVISMQIESVLSYLPSTDISRLIQPELLERVYKLIDEGFIDLKDLKMKAGNDISFPLLRIALAKKKAR